MAGAVEVDILHALVTRIGHELVRRAQVEQRHRRARAGGVLLTRRPDREDAVLVEASRDVINELTMRESAITPRASSRAITILALASPILRIPGRAEVVIKGPPRPLAHDREVDVAALVLLAASGGAEDVHRLDGEIPAETRRRAPSARQGGLHARQDRDPRGSGQRE